MNLLIRRMLATWIFWRANTRQYLRRITNPFAIAWRIVRDDIRGWRWMMQAEHWILCDCCRRQYHRHLEIGSATFGRFNACSEPCCKKLLEKHYS